MAGGHGLGAATFFKGDIDAADPTGTEGLEIRGVAKGGDGVESQIAAQEGDDGLAGLDLLRTVVDVGDAHGWEFFKPQMDTDGHR